MVIIKQNQQIASVGKDMEKLEHLCTIGGNVKWYNHYGKQYGSSSKTCKYNYHMIQYVIQV